MALVTVSGLPSSGRSFRSHQIKHELEHRIRAAPSSSKAQLPSRVVIVSDHDVHVDRSAYASQRSEKPARASYLSAVTRALGKDTIVIADGGAGLNIKGFRYQLWCAAREVGVKCLTVHVHAPPRLCAHWNAQRRSEHGADASYDDETLDSLCMRYEEPNAMTRWDSPLFLVSAVLQTQDDSTPIESSHVQLDPLPADDIWTAATQGQAHKAPEVVTPTRSTTSSYLSLLESSTQHILSLILAHTSTLGFQPGATIPLTSPTLVGPSPLSLTIPTDKQPTLASLQRLRRHFVKIHNAGSAAINELGLAAREEGGLVALSPQEAGAARTSQQATPEYMVAKRFVAWLEGML
ncbi:kti12, chromatin associated [Thecaphora frezii]